MLCRVCNYNVRILQQLCSILKRIPEHKRIQWNPGSGRVSTGCACIVQWLRCMDAVHSAAPLDRWSRETDEVPHYLEFTHDCMV